MGAIRKPPVNAKGGINKLRKLGKAGALGGIANVAFVGIDSSMRMQDGESAPVAVGKALVTNAAFSLIPGGIYGAVAVGVATAAPEIMNQLDTAAANLDSKKKQFGGNFQESEPQLTMMQQGISRMQITRQMANHARGAQKVY
ncbi:hypothetical protein KC480_05500 [Bacillus velezensis]|uniref:hypothetical protein n=1 Tax=Bacillus velezensis TaxID=492670 RepID=UPI001E5F0579|nr:hypothetical protein [Bacillus velezensis]MCD7910980.1 hypothetical protein [Bacillus velezensis]